MKKWRLFPLVVALVTPLWAAPSQKEDALSAIAVMENNFACAEAAAAAQVVATFAEENHEVAVPVSPANLPWLTESWELDEANDSAIRTMILGAYIAGIVKKQLNESKITNDPYQGWVFAIRAYRQFQQRVKFSSPSLEKMSVMNQTDSLKTYAQELAKKARVSTHSTTPLSSKS